MKEILIIHENMHSTHYLLRIKDGVHCLAHPAFRPGRPVAKGGRRGQKGQKTHPRWENVLLLTL